MSFRSIPERNQSLRPNRTGKTEADDEKTSIRLRLVLIIPAAIAMTGMSALLIGRTLARNALEDEIRNRLITPIFRTRR